MKLKTYFSGTVEAAMELARKELGPDALLIHARPSTEETRSLGALEVVFGVPPPETAAAPAAGDSEAARLGREVALLKKEMERLTGSLNTALRGATGSAAPVKWGSGTRAAGPQVDLDLDPALAWPLAHGEKLGDLLSVDASLGRPGAARRVVALVGPPGVGKTTTLVKLAARYGLATRRPAWILSLDVHRIAAAEQLRTLATILGIGCGVVETPRALRQVLEELSGKELIFIDTPGLADAEMPDALELAGALAQHPEMDTHLVLSASMKRKDLARACERFDVFRPGKILWTRVDETGSLAAIASETARRGLPVSFLATGQAIPQDLEPATIERIEAALADGAAVGDGGSAGTSEGLSRKAAA